MKRTNEFGITGEQAEDQTKPTESAPVPVEQAEAPKPLEEPKPVEEKKND